MFLFVSLCCLLFLPYLLFALGVFLVDFILSLSPPTGLSTASLTVFLTDLLTGFLTLVVTDLLGVALTGIMPCLLRVLHNSLLAESLSGVLTGVLTGLFPSLLA